MLTLRSQETGLNVVASSFPTVWLWATCLTSLGLDFLFYKMESLLVPRDVVNDKLSKWKSS